MSHCMLGHWAIKTTFFIHKVTTCFSHRSSLSVWASHAAVRLHSHQIRCCSEDVSPPCGSGGRRKRTQANTIHHHVDNLNKFTRGVPIRCPSDRYPMLIFFADIGPISISDRDTPKIYKTFQPTHKLTEDKYSEIGFL